MSTPDAQPRPVFDHNGKIVGAYFGPKDPTKEFVIRNPEVTVITSDGKLIKPAPRKP